MARAIYERRSKRTGYVWPDDVYPAVRNRCLSDARAAIEALRTPTREMYHAAVMTHVHENGGIEHSPGLSWKTMIDAILSEGE